MSSTRVIQQHLRALKAMDYEPSGPFITSVLELKLDVNTVFEWQKHSQDSTDVPHYQRLLEFINLRSQASETPASRPRAMKYILLFDQAHCIICSKCRRYWYQLHLVQQHPLYDGINTQGEQIVHELSEAWAFRQTMQVTASLQEVSKATPHTATCRARTRLSRLSCHLDALCSCFNQPRR